MEACGKSTSRNRGMKTLKIQCNVLKLALGWPNDITIKYLLTKTIYAEINNFAIISRVFKGNSSI